MKNDKESFGKLLTEKLPQRIRYYLSIACISFTAVEIIMSILQVIYPEDLMSSTVWIFNLEAFAVCLTITVLMFFTDVFTYNFSKILGILIHLVDITVVVMLLGGFVFHWFPFKWEFLLLVLGVIFAVYIIVYGAMVFSTRVTSYQVNKKIIERKEQKKNGREDY